MQFLVPKEMKPGNDSACIGRERASKKSARFADVHGDLPLPITVETTSNKCASSSSSKVADNNIGNGQAQLHNVQFDRSKSAAAQALHKFKFIARTKDGVLMKWDAVAKLFDELTLTSNGQLPSSKFGQCLGSDYSDCNLYNDCVPKLNNYCLKNID